MLLLVAPALALDGQPGMHDPSTVIEAGGKFYVYATGNGLPAFVSDDGWTWRRAGSVMQAVPGGKPGPDVIARGGNNTWAPDIIRVGDKYFLYYAAPGPQPKAAIGLLVGKTLDPASPDYKWEDGGQCGLRRARHPLPLTKYREFALVMLSEPQPARLRESKHLAVPRC